VEMTDTQKTVYVFSSVVWNFYRTRPHEVALSLRSRGFRVVFVEPIVYRGAISTRLQALTNTDPFGVQIVKRTSRLKKSALLWVIENVRNMMLIVRRNPDCIIAGDIWMSVGIATLSRFLGRQFFFDNMDYWPGVEKTPLQRWLVKHLLYPYYGFVSSAVLNTSHFLQQYMQRYSQRSLYVPNGKTMQEVTEYERAVSCFSARTIHHKVVFIATLRDWYDYDLLIAVFSVLPEVSLHIYGDGPMKQSIIQKSSAFSNIMVHEKVPTTQVPFLIAESDFGVLPVVEKEATKGVMPIKLLDYWAAKKPVLATPVAEMITLATGGGCITRSTQAEWVEAIQQWYSHEEHMQAIGLKGHERLHKEFLYDTLIKKVEENFLTVK